MSEKQAGLTNVFLCTLDELAATGSKEFSVDASAWPLRGFVVQNGDTVAAYVNRCPHAGHPLNMRPDQFLTADRSLVMCNSHGALFELSTGVCVDGPCAGRRLQHLPIRIEENRVMLDGDLDELARAYA